MIDLREMNWFFLSFSNSLDSEVPQIFQPSGPSHLDFATLSAWKMNQALRTIEIEFKGLEGSSQVGLAVVR
jgi:hypothetical protein